MKHMRGVDPNEAPAKKRVIFDHRFWSIIYVIALWIILAAIPVIALNLTQIQIAGISDESLQIICTMAAAFIELIVYHIHFRREFNGFVGLSSQGLLLVLPMLLFIPFNLIHFKSGISFAWNEAPMNPIPRCILMALSAGFCEETVFRGMSQSNWMRTSNNGRGIFCSTLVSALIFGVVHAFNVFGGGDLYSTLFQVCYAFLLGIAFGAIFLRCGTIWPGVIAHALIDFSSFLFMDLSSNGAITETLTIDTEFYIVVGLSVFVALYGLFLLRPSKHEEICDLWHRKWHKGA